MKYKNIQTEIDACFLYRRLAEVEKDENLQHVFTHMSKIEESHVRAFARKAGLKLENVAGPSWRARTLDGVGRVFGYDYVLGALLDTEKDLASAVVATKKRNREELSGSESNHVKILKSILDNEEQVTGTQLSKFEKRHRSVGGNAIRAAVLGGNDGLVSNFSLVMGVAGAASGSKSVLMAGLAGMFAGALSMALGEWISVRSSQELYENQMNLEMEELETNPEAEMLEMVLIYMAKGIPEEQAREMAAHTILDKSKSHEILVKEELGIDPTEMGDSALEAALYSFLLFSVGAIIPIFPFFFWEGTPALIACAASSAAGLFLIGAAITLFTNKNVWWSGFRQVVFGLAAAAITFGIGHLIGVSIAG